MSVEKNPTNGNDQETAGSQRTFPSLLSSLLSSPLGIGLLLGGILLGALLVRRVHMLLTPKTPPTEVTGLTPTVLTETVPGEMPTAVPAETPAAVSAETVTPTPWPWDCDLLFVGEQEVRPLMAGEVFTLPDNIVVECVQPHKIKVLLPTTAPTETPSPGECDRLRVGEEEVPPLTVGESVTLTAMVVRCDGPSQLTISWSETAPTETPTPVPPETVTVTLTETVAIGTPTATLTPTAALTSSDPLLPSLLALGFSSREELIAFFAMDVTPAELHQCEREIACVAVKHEKDSHGNIPPFKACNPTGETFDGWRHAYNQPWQPDWKGEQGGFPPGCWLMEGVTLRPWANNN